VPKKPAEGLKTLISGWRERTIPHTSSVVFINNRDNVHGKAFTLVYAIVHILMGESAVLRLF